MNAVHYNIEPATVGAVSRTFRRTFVNVVTDEKKMPSGEEFNRLLIAVGTRRDREAFALLFKHFGPRLKSYLMRLGTTASTAEAPAQEAMPTVWRNACYFDPSRGGAATWIFTIVRNLHLDLHLKNRRLEVIHIATSDAVARQVRPGSAAQLAGG